MNKIPKSFYLQSDVVSLAKQLIGKRISTHFKGEHSSGIITETEAYEGITDKASHAFGNRRTKRTETLYQEGGIAYVYLCYGIHHLFNVVTNQKDIPHAVLIRAIAVEQNIPLMLERRGHTKADNKFNIGPGKISKSLGITTKENGIDLQSKKLWIEDIGLKDEDMIIKSSPRIGIDYAEEDAFLPYRFELFEIKNKSLNI